MLKDGGNKNGKTNTQTKKKHVSLATTTKTTTTLQVLRTSFLHFFVVVLHDHSVKLSSYTFLGANVSCSQEKFCFLCSCSLSFSLPLIFTILAAKIYHFHFQIWLFFLFLFFVLSLALALSLLRLGFVVVVFLFLKVRVAKMTITSAFIIMLNTGCSLDTGKQIISHWLPCGADGRTGGRAEGRTVTWQPKFLACMNNQIFLPMVLHWRAPLYEF